MTRVEKCLNAYQHVLKVLEMNNDNYFRRTQIVMIVAQSGLSVAFAKLSTSSTNTFQQLPKATQSIPLLVVASLGVAFAFVWRVFIVRQGNVLNLCKTHLMYIEDSLMRLGVPSGYWTYESMVSNPESYTKRQECGKSLLDTLRCETPSLFPGWLFPCKSKKLKIGLTTIEEQIATSLCVGWGIIIFLAFLAVFGPMIASCF